MEFDDTTKGFYKSIGIEDYHRALPYYAWTKGQPIAASSNMPKVTG